MIAPDEIFVSKRWLKAGLLVICPTGEQYYEDGTLSTIRYIDADIVNDIATEVSSDAEDKGYKEGLVDCLEETYHE